jgi:diaminohydroxyphosphoribosylaminopyrimidine deaminase/5-amino-6-(5-phosphoribosylamino)uracil reductase
MANGVEVTEGVLGDACARLHAPFFKLVKTGLPWVMLKMALGSDGAIGPKGKRVNVTPKEIQELAHALRRASDGIMVGRSTVEIDDPTLTDRWPTKTEPHRVFRRIVLDSRAQLGGASKIWQRAEGHSAIRALTVGADPIDGVEDLRLPPGPGGCSLRHLLIELGLRGACRLLAEGGPTLARQLLDENLVDVLHIFRSAKPAGGESVLLDTARFGKSVAQAEFNGGVWEICERSQGAA